MSDIGHYDMIVSRRESLVRNLSPAARHNAFPRLYAQPVPISDPTKPLLAKVERLERQIERLKVENERLRKKAIDDARMRAVNGERQAIASVDQVLTEYLKALKGLDYKIYGDDVTLEQLKGQRRARVYIYPRHVAMWLCVRLTGVSLPTIGKAFGGRDHTSVMHGRDKALAILDSTPQLKAAAMVVLATFGISE